MCVTFIAGLASTVFLQPWFSLTGISNTFSFIGIRISIFRACFTGTTLFEDISFIDAFWSVNSCGKVIISNHIWRNFNTFSISGNGVAITVRSFTYNGAAHVLIILTLKWLEWAWSAFWTCHSLEHLGIFRAWWEGFACSIVCVRNHIVITNFAISTVLFIPNLIDRHRVAIGNAKCAIVIGIFVRTTLDIQLTIWIKDSVQCWVANVSLASSWEANFTGSNITVIKNWSWIVTSLTRHAETIIINKVEFW